jgi:2-oxoglutarate ferredoxin oxidoreductase subunit alpha
MEFLAKELPKVGGVVIQAEDEIAAINMAVGASFSGVRAMTATSGPGLSLMVEAMGLASMTETPIVVVDVQRAGPATGMPTKTAQGDLYLALYAGNDDPPRIVLAPSSVEDCFYQTINAFNLAERYQMPVILLSDQALAPRVETCPPFRLDDIQLFDREIADVNGDGAYQRYKITETGVSPMTVPGMAGGHYTSEGLEHNEKGNPNYTPEMHLAMMEKRQRKIETARQQLTLWANVVEEWGDDNAAIAIMGWGSSLGPVQEAMARAQAAGYKVAALFPKVLLPMPDLRIRRFLRGRRAIIIPELNLRGQFARVIEHRYSHELIRDNIEVVSFTKYEGLPFRPVEIFEKIQEVSHSLGRRASVD